MTIHSTQGKTNLKKLVSLSCSMNLGARLGNDVSVVVASLLHTIQPEIFVDTLILWVVFYKNIAP